MPPLYCGVPDEPNYQVGDDGSVWTLHRKGVSKDAERRGEWRRMRLSTCGAGYLQVKFRGPGYRKTWLVAPLVLTVFVGPPPVDMPNPQAAHWDGCITNNEATNLRWATPLGNAADKTRHGTTPQGERNGNATMTAEVVMEARRLRVEGLSWLYISQLLGVSYEAIRQSGRGARWKHLAGPWPI